MRRVMIKRGYLPWLLISFWFMHSATVNAKSNSMPGCERTDTKNYSKDMASDWKAGKSSGKIIIASDPQYDRVTLPSGEEGIDKNKSEQNLRAIFKDISQLRAQSSDYIPVMINGDLTEYGHGNQRSKTQDLLWILGEGNVNAAHKRKGPIFMAGLGNHDYENNVGHCTNNGCARDSVCDVVQWTTQLQPGKANFDYNFVNPTHSGSLAWSVNIGQIHLVQLNLYPTYSVHFETGGGSTGTWKKRKFAIASSVDWLKKDLATARAEHKLILVNFHNPKDWNHSATSDQQFATLLTTNHVAAVFVGHYHAAFGPATLTYPAMEGTPVYHSGALFKKEYLELEYDLTNKWMKIYKVYLDKDNKRQQVEIPSPDISRLF